MHIIDGYHAMLLFEIKIHICKYLIGTSNVYSMNHPYEFHFDTYVMVVWMWWISSNLSGMDNVSMALFSKTVYELLTPWGREKMAAVFQTTFSNAFSWMKIYIPLKFVPKGSMTNIPALVQIMAWCRAGDKPLSEPMLVVCFTDAYMRHSASMS